MLKNVMKCLKKCHELLKIAMKCYKTVMKC